MSYIYMLSFSKFNFNDLELLFIDAYTYITASSYMLSTLTYFLLFLYLKSVIYEATCSYFCFYDL